jgi:hypothetical protein
MHEPFCGAGVLERGHEPHPFEETLRGRDQASQTSRAHLTPARFMTTETEHIPEAKAGV